MRAAACLKVIPPGPLLAIALALSYSIRALAQAAPEGEPAPSVTTEVAPGLGMGAASEEDARLSEQRLQARIQLGKTYASGACRQCHLLPDPNLLDKKSWQNYILPKMMLYAGLSSLDQVKVEDKDLVKASGIVPSVPRITRDHWGPIVTYYLQSAPEQALTQAAKPEVKIGLKQFRVEPPRFRHDPPLTTLVKIDAAERKIYVADARSQTLDCLNADGIREASIEIGNIAVALTKTERGLYLACIGHYFPSERKQGQIILLEKRPEGYTRKVILSDLPRISGLEIADLNGDGRKDMVACMFGYLTGRLSWYENLGGDDYREHVLFPKAGPMQAIVHDFDQDGTPDIAALMGQESDGVLGFFNDKQSPGTFKEQDIVRWPPSYGPDAFEAVDFNKDGLMDLLVANGDAADYPQPPKRYHGIRLFLNKGRGIFERAYFFPLNGAFRAVARDFDGDGDLDIAAVAFFPDYELRPREGFVYLENQGEMKFTAATFQQSMTGRWVTLDAGDIDGDGDEDIVLGSMTDMPGSFPPPQLKEFWDKRGPSVVILRNLAKDR
jgi:hypothetical protein